jgi:hypothetical protein
MYSAFSYRLLSAAAVVLSFAASRGAGAQQAKHGMAQGEPVGGVSCDAQEGSRIHIHQHLLILDHGKEVAIPPNVGQVPAKRCLYWIHTHTPDGILHIEAPLNRSFTLGDFFNIWGEPLSRSEAASAHAGKGQTLHVFVNGKRYEGDPRKISLVAHADIVIEAGPPFPKPPVFTNWGTL